MPVSGRARDGVCKEEGALLRAHPEMLSSITSCSAVGEAPRRKLGSGYQCVPIGLALIEATMRRH